MTAVPDSASAGLSEMAKLDERHEPPRPSTVFGSILKQAFWLSMAYLGIGTFIEGMRRTTGAEFWNQATQFVDSVALMLLRRAGFIDPLFGAAARNQIGPFGMRLLLSTITIGAIFIQAVALAGVFAILLLISRRRSRP